MSMRQGVRVAGETIARALLAAAAAGTLVGCVESRERYDTVEVATEALVDGGVATDSATPDLRAVGRFVGYGGCSATLIAPRTVLMAAHCVFAYAQGCSISTTATPSVIFADENGDPAGMNAQTIAIVGVATHPDAYGLDPVSKNFGRTKACPDPVPPPTTCPDPVATPGALSKPSCAQLSACFPNGFGALPACTLDDAGNPIVCPQDVAAQTVIGWGLKPEHDFALAYLEKDPTDIAPLPVLTRGWSDPSHGIYEAKASVFDPWVAGQPIVTIAGYGQGSKASITRDLGQIGLLSPQTAITPPVDCNGNAGPAVNREIWVLKTSPGEAQTVEGDSGGPVFFGKAPVIVGPTPNTLPAGAGLTEQRYVVGVASQGGGLQSLYPSLLEPDNAAWLKARLADFDSDGVKNANDNCVGIPNSGQANCNADAEADRKGLVLGDACDPVPCPQGEAVATQTIGSTSSWISITRTIADKLQLNTLGSHNFYNGAAVADPGIQTYFRFCQPNAARGVTCAVVDGQRTHPQLHQTPTGTGTNPWLWVTLTGIPVNTQPPVDYPSSPSFTWDFETSYSTWRASNLIDAAPAPPFGFSAGSLPYTGLNGVFALRAGDATETLGSSYRPDNGVHPSPADSVYQAGAVMARHYFDAAPDFVSMKVSGKATCATCLLPLCPSCSLTLPEPTCSDCPLDRRPDWGDIFTLIPGNDGRWTMVNPVLPGDDSAWRLSPAIRAKLGDAAIRYVPDVDPGLFHPQTIGSGFAEGALVSAVGNALDSLAVRTSRGLALAQEPITASDASAHGGQRIQVSLPATATLRDAAMGSLAGPVSVGDRVQVLGATSGFATVTGIQGQVTLGSKAKVGSLFSDTSVNLKSQAAVNGSLWAATTLQADPSALVTGSRTVGQAITSGDNEPWSVFYPTANQGNRSVEPSHVMTLTPGAFADVSVKTSAKLTLSAGTYFFENLTLEPSSTLDLDNRTGAVYLYVHHQLIYRGKTTERDATKPNVLFGVLGTEMVTIEAPFRGTVVAPSAQIKLGTVASPGHVGAFYGKSLQVDPDSTIKHRPFSRSDCTGTFGCLGGWEPSGAIPNVSRSLGITARTDFVPVFVARSSLLYIIGGTEVSSGTLTKQMIAWDIGAGVGRALQSLFAPEKVLGATVSFLDDWLWVLDQLQSGDVRLTHIDPVSGRSRIVWQGSRSAGFDHYWLQTDLDGSLLIFAASTTGSGYSTLRTRWLPFSFGSERTYKVLLGVGKLLGPGQPGPAGITYVQSDASGLISAIRQSSPGETEIANLGEWL